MENAISRRTFLAGAAAVGAMGVLGGCSTSPSSSAAGGAAAGTYNPGTYSCEAMGLGRVNVEVTFDAESITDIAIDTINETHWGMDAAPILKETILNEQNTAVDAVSGATLTSNAVKKAVSNCIDQAMGAQEQLAADDLVSPIEAAETPDQWDYEADVVIVGASTGGLIAAGRLAEAGLDVIVLEKESDVGGCGRISSCIQVYGGVAGAFDEDPNVGFFGTPYHDMDVVDWFMRRCQWTADANLLLNTAISLRETTQWWMDNYKQLCTPHAGGWWVFGSNPPSTGANRPLIDFERTYAEDFGTQILFETYAENLVMDNGTCIGCVATGPDGKTLYIKGKKAVVLGGEGMQRNHAMIEKYEGLLAATHGAMAKGTGHLVRLGQGAGADMAGMGSFGTNDMHPVVKMADRDENLMPMSTSVNNPFLTLFRLPWLRVDKHCDRLPLVTTEVTLKTQGYLGDNSEPVHYSAAEELSRGGSYIIFDDNWMENYQLFADSDNGGHYNNSITSIGEERDPYFFQPEWQDAADTIEEARQGAIDKGLVKVADTIEELAEMLELDPAELSETVKQWNEAAEKGEDDPVYHTDIKAMRPIVKAPFYGVFSTPCAYGTYAGLKVTPKMEVVNTDGDVIPGLYATFMTAGGLAGQNQVAQCCMGDQFGSMSASGWNVAKAILGEDYVQI